MSATQPEIQTAQVPVTPTDALAREAVQKPEQAVAAEAIAANDGSIAPKERAPLPRPESTEQVQEAASPILLNGTETAIPTNLASIRAVIEANAAKQAGELIAQANAQGANLPTHGLAVTVKIDRAPTVVATTPEAHACAGVNCSHCAAPAKAEASATPSPDAATNTSTTAPAPVATMAEQPAIAEVKPEGLTITAQEPARTIATPVASEATIVPQHQLAIGA